MTDFTQWVRPNILQLAAYRSARKESSSVNLIQLDANESPWTPYGSYETYNRYPEPQPIALKATLSRLYGVADDQILMTRGMDESIDLLIRTFCEPKQDSIAIITPTFSYYGVAANINDVGIVACRDLNDQVATRTQAKILFLCTPNNPTGESISLATIESLCQTQHGIVAVDEAYIEFSAQASAVTLMARYPQLIVMRTLSKAYGLAGLRLGVTLAHADIISMMSKVIPPYPLPTPTTAIALQALSPLGLAKARERIGEIVQERDRLYRLLSDSVAVRQVYPSDANFLLCVFDDHLKVFQRLKSQGLLVRNRDQDLDQALRITIGTPDQNNLLLQCLGVLPPANKLIRSAHVFRKTKETEIVCDVRLDGLAMVDCQTGLPFFDHMLDQIGRHSGLSLRLHAVGDLAIDAHHTVEDVAIVLGQALSQALGDRFGLARYGFLLPMDESEAQVSLDLSGRPYAQFQGDFPNDMVGDMPTAMVAHFFESLSQHLLAAVHITVTGHNTHHMVEACFKGFAKALGMAIESVHDRLPSSKGVL
jgi:histidinol-phosphate aminotransferase/imidazoleglycerol-phosphate dehydratase/histidinol-phosphatase